MRYKEVHVANAMNTLPKEEEDLIELLEGRRVCHIGCLVGTLLGKLNSPDDVLGTEDYPMARRYGKKKNGVKIIEVTSDVFDKSYDVVVLDPDYYPESHDILISEATRIARERIIIGVKYGDILGPEYDNCNQRLINDKYQYVDLDGDDSECSDSTEE